MAEIKYENSNAENNAMEYGEHEKTYALFITLVKWGVILNVLLLAFMAATLV